MEEKCGDGVHSVECLEKNFMALQKKMEDDFSQVETIQMKVKALSADWEERHHQLKVEQEKVAELEAQIKLLNTKQEEVMASLQADMLRAASQIQEKEELAERLKSEVSFLEKRVRVACEEAAWSAAELEKGAHEARLALEATLSSLCPQLDREEVARETFPSKQKTLPPLQPRVQFLYGLDAKCPRKAEGAEAAAEEAPQGLPQEAVGGLQEEAKPRASRAAWVSLCPLIFFWLPKGMPLGPWSHWSRQHQAVSRSPLCFQNCRAVSLRILSGKRLCSLERGENCYFCLVTAAFFLRCVLLKRTLTWSVE